tara:strand:- start:58 stop:435 length:378 start_codon:yes stop_codon:yes gene_type:complete
MATPNNFKITQSIGSTDNFAGPEVSFFYITLITADGSTVLDVRTELGYDETLHNVQRAILQRGTILYQRIEDGATGRIDIAMERPGWTAATLQTAIRDLGTTVGTNNKDVSMSTVTKTELKLDNS